jgi:hypothetical protein
MAALPRDRNEKRRTMNAASALVAAFFKTLRVRQERAVLLVEISAPPMNLLGPELVRDLVFLYFSA